MKGISEKVKRVFFIIIGTAFLLIGFIGVVILFCQLLLFYYLPQLVFFVALKDCTDG